jgi:photosystem II stability/assembly factor-like uncharacterized protein/tetratricopeptide (TPR) repeat protein
MRVFLSTMALVLATAAATRAADLRYAEDAALHAVHFVDGKEGWAVGDEGVIWHTIDGGRTWERQATGLRASLRGVYFLNPFLGWAVGREELPGGQASAGVLLLTRDGGLIWQRLLPNTMPGLNQVCFVNERIGFVVGDGSEQFPSGVFRTRDGGRTWEPVRGPRYPSWLGAAFWDEDNGVLAGAWTRLAALRDEKFFKADVDPLGGRTLYSVYIQPRRSIAVGQGGLVLASSTRGARWGYPRKLNLSADMLANLDLHAVHGAGSHVWAAGRPGSVLLHSADGGDTWHMQKTGQPLPIHGLFFKDEKNGWAVGDLGLILATSDGGATWTVRRQGGKRSALLMVHARAADVPVDALAQLGAEDGYLAIALGVVAPDPESARPGDATRPARLAASARSAGAAVGEMLWQFPLPPHLADADKQALLNYWNVSHDGRADQQLLRQMVLALRTWRPNVVITDALDGHGSQAGALVAEAIDRAVPMAADAGAFPEQIETMGLTPWKTAKTYCLTAKRSEARAVLDNVKDWTRLGGSARDFAAGSLALLVETPADLPRERFFRLLGAGVIEKGKLAHLMEGVPLAPGSEARRQLPEETATDKDSLKAYRTRRTMEALAANLSNANRTLAQIKPLLAQMPDDQGAAAALAIANQYVRKGQWTLARETFLLMVDNYPAHPLSAGAYRWLIQHTSSSEARRRNELEQFMMVQQTGFSQDQVKKRGTDVVQTSRLTYLSDLRETRQWYRGCQEFAKRLSGYGPLYASDPSIQLCLQSARRSLGQFQEAHEMYKRLSSYLPPGPAREAAAAELWLENRAGNPPKALAVCRRAEQKPFLDGKFDDACWQGMKPVVLTNAVGKTSNDYVTEAWFAYDDNNLYVALRCRHPKGLQVPATKPRPRDADLRPYDRVSLLFDLDRDYATYYHLQMDQRGWVREDCWGDASWDPTWFVAVYSEEDFYQLEAAIPLSELTGDRIRRGSAWACNIVRIVPGRGVQTLSLPAGVDPRPEGMGLLLFTQPASK